MLYGKTIFYKLHKDEQIFDCYILSGGLSASYNELQLLFIEAIIVHNISYRSAVTLNFKVFQIFILNF